MEYQFIQTKLLNNNFIGRFIQINSYKSSNLISASLVFLIIDQIMKALTQKVSFRLKKNKTETEKAILLNQKYSSNMRQLYQLLHQQNKLPKQKPIQTIKQQLNHLEENMSQQLQLYKPYENKQLEKFLTDHNIPNAYSLISIYQDKQNQIENIKSKLTHTQQIKQKQSKSTNKQETIELLRQHLQEQKNRRMASFIKIEKIKQQLQLETKSLIENKVTNFDEEIQFRKLQKANVEGK